MRVFVNGCFDILHVGHISLLEYASSFGPLTVGINSDDSVARKKPGRPVNNLDDRIDMLYAIKHVYEVIPFAEDDPSQLIQRLCRDPNRAIKIIVKVSE